MKVSKEQVEENKRRIIGSAASLFRERGFDGVGLADIMRSASLTNGAFYGHFESKQALAAQACSSALTASAAEWSTSVDGGSDLSQISAGYLSKRHRKNRSEGCAFAALASEAPRHEPAIGQAFADGLDEHIAVLGPLMAADSGRERREQALAAMSTLVGALILSRATEGHAMSDEILNAVKKLLGDQHA